MIDWRNAPAGTQFKAGIGFSTVYPDFDFECYSEGGYVWHPELQKWKSLPGLADQTRGLTAVGTRNYVQHPTFEVTSLSWDLKDGKGKRWWRPHPDTPYKVYPRYVLGQRSPWFPWELLEYIEAGGTIEAWGFGFEWQVWTFHCVPVLGWPPLKQEQGRCAQAKARANAFPGGLEDAGIVLGLTEKKDPAGRALIKKLTVPKNPTKGNSDLRWTPFTAAEDFRRFYDYNKQDILAESEGSSKLQDLTPREFRIWQTDLRINMRGMHIDLVAVENCIAILEQAEIKYNAELRQITHGAVQGSSKVADMQAWMARQGVHLYGLDEEEVEAALERKDYPDNVLRVLRIRQTLAFGSVRKLYALRAQTTPDGRLCDQYIYYGAHTALWNGRGFQPANLYRGIFSKPEEAERALRVISARCLELVEYEFYPHDALEIVASCLRSLIIARPGHRLMSADYSSIQAVATSCMANEPWRIEVFRTHGKFYEALASRLTGKPLQFYIDYKKQHNKHHPDRQDWGKLPALSGDFGAWVGGWKRFGADKILGSDANIKAAIKKTRAAQPAITNYWGGQTINKFENDVEKRLFGLEGAAISAVLSPGTAFGYRGVVYQMHEDTLYCRPPSGGFIRYHAPQLQKSTRNWAEPWEYDLSYEGWNTNTKKGRVGWVRMSLYGGVLTQNSISHMCREIQADTIVRLEDHGYPVDMHTHDENVADVPNGYGSMEEYLRLVKILPSWAVCDDGQPWPVRVPGAWEGQFYGKWED